MCESIGRSLREKISAKYLDWAEILPKFQGGFIHGFQSIREIQREWSTERSQNRVKPDDSSITLDQIRFIITFQLEDFHPVQHAVGKLFPNSAKVGASAFHETQ